jgi:hypothetical protein
VEEPRSQPVIPVLGKEDHRAIAFLPNRGRATIVQSGDMLLTCICIGTLSQVDLGGFVIKS